MVQEQTETEHTELECTKLKRTKFHQPYVRYVQYHTEPKYTEQANVDGTYSKSQQYGTELLLTCYWWLL